MPELLTFVVLSAATYRIARFLVLDSLIDGTRDQVYQKLMVLPPGETIPLWRSKLADLMTCSYCATVWIAAAVTLFYSLVIADWIGWAFLLVWPAVAAGSLVFWAYIDNEE